MEGMSRMTSSSWPTAADQSGVSATETIYPLSSLETNSQAPAATEHPEMPQPDRKSSLNSCPEWQNYTNKVPNCDPVEVDIANYHLKLEKHILSDHFVGDLTQIEVLSVRCNDFSDQDPAAGQFFPNTNNEHVPDLKSIKIRSLKKVEETLIEAPQESAFLFMTLTPRYSFSKLPICKEALLKLLTCYSVLPQFTDVLVTFGEKTDQTKENFGIYEHILQNPLATTTESHFLEVCYNLKYIACREDVNKKGTSIFTTRKTGIWSRYSPETNHTVWFLVHPPARFNARLKDMLKGSKLSERRGVNHYMDHHRLLLSCINENWTDYISELEEGINVLNTDTCHSSLRGNGNQLMSLKPSIEDAQTIQKNNEKLQELSKFLEMNQWVIKSLKASFGRYRQITQKCRAVGTTPEEADFEDAVFEKFNASLDEHLNRISHHQKLALFGVERCGQLNALVTNVLASRENLIMRDIQKEATQYSRSMRLITVVTMAFLPATFTATLFSTDFLKVLPDQPNWMYGIAFFIAVVLFTVITFGCWRVYEHVYFKKPSRSEGRSKTEVSLENVFISK
ncbi:hypothetical protein K440DRAFT_641259 [Wilcoxina mikolae CBS 423.85]|nr:hypothetical protein K440DRAFT_641259 [Wilcoxina mikolae CBS 423.85]